MIEFFIYTTEPAPTDVASLSLLLDQAGWTTHTLRGWLGDRPMEVVTHGALQDNDSTIGYHKNDPDAPAIERAIAQRDISKLKQWIDDGRLGYLMWSTHSFRFSEHSEFESLEDARHQMGDQYADFLAQALRQYIVTNTNRPEFAASVMGAVALLANGIIEDPQLGRCISAPKDISQVTDFLNRWPLLPLAKGPNGRSGYKLMRHQFRAKTWIYWTQFLIFGGFGLFGLVYGPLFWTGSLVDIHGKVSTEAGPPLTIFGLFTLTIAILAAFNIIGRRHPIIRCYREGIECNLVGATSLDGVPLIPNFLRVAWAILSLEGLRSQRIRSTWADYKGTELSGVPMAYVLTLNGLFTNLQAVEISPCLVFTQTELRDHPKVVLDTVNQYSADVTLRNQLPSWSTCPNEKMVTCLSGN